MADLTRVRQNAYSDPKITSRTAEALMTMAQILTDLAEDKPVDLTTVIRNVRSNPDVAAAWVFASLSALSPDLDTAHELRRSGAAILRYSELGPQDRK